MALNEIAMRKGCQLEWTMVLESGPQHLKFSESMEKCGAKIFSFTSKADQAATLKTRQSSSSREVAVLRRRVATLKQEQEQRKGEVQEQEEQIRKISQVFEELEESLRRKQKKMGKTTTRQLYEYAAQKGFSVEFKFLEPINFQYMRRMRFMERKELIGYYRDQLSGAGQEFYGNFELPQEAKHNAAVQALEILTAGGAMTGTAAGETESLGALTPTLGSCGTGQANKKNANMALNEIAMRKGCQLKWTMVSESGPQHLKFSESMEKYVAAGCNTRARTGAEEGRGPGARGADQED